jgi:tetratricopeptide (TPR) repeat protein
MKKRKPAAAVFTLLALLARPWPAPGATQRDRWFEVRSPHFVVISNAGEKQARSVAQEFERVRALLRGLLGNARVETRDPVVVLAVGSERGLRELLPQYWDRKGQHPLGAYWKGPHRHDVVLRVDAPYSERYRRILHEYVHLLTHASVTDLPAWLDEGLSEFWSTAIVQSDGVEIGRPALHQLATLKARHSWIPLDELLAMERAPDGRDLERLSMFYAQSWALTHYVMLGGSPNLHPLARDAAGAPVLELAPSKYVERLRERGPAEAGVLAFGDLSQLERALAAYVHEGRFRTLRIHIPQSQVEPPEIEDLQTRVRVLSPAESLAIRAGFLADGERPSAALPLLREALAADPNETSALETLGYVHFQQNNAVEAARWFDRAIDSGGATYLAYFYRAILAGPVPNHLEDDLRCAIDLNPGFAESYVRLADVYSQEPDRLEEALPLVRRATELEPDNAAYWLDLGKLLLRLHRTDEAREVGRQGLTVASWSPGSRELLGAFLRGLER